MVLSVTAKLGSINGMESIAIRGRGVAASCCAHLLSGSGFQLTLTDAPRPGVPAIVVSAATQALVCDVFERPEIFAGLARIDRRVVTWGPKAEMIVLPHSAVVLSEDQMIARVNGGDGAGSGATGGSSSDESVHSSWSILASRPLAHPAIEEHFGTRIAFAAAAVLKEPEASACWVESLEWGWLFLVPGWLIAVGGPPESLLGQSRTVADQISSIGTQSAEFPAHPRIASPLCAPGWLACGTAAMAFDPICGDGTGNAIREAILAAAVIRAAASGESEDALLAHYRQRLTAGFRRHLELSLAFYRAGNSGPWWQSQIDAMERGVAWCAGQLSVAPRFRYRLSGFDLLPITED